MPSRLIAVDHGVDLGPFADEAVAFLGRHLTPVHEGIARYYVDAAALAALEEQVDKATARAFEDSVRERLTAMDPAALRVLVERELRPLSAELRVTDRYDELRPDLERLFEALPAQHRPGILDAAFERTDLTALAALPANRRQDLLEDVYRLMPLLGSDVSRTVRHNYTQLALAFLTAPTTIVGVGGHVPGFDPGHDPMFTPGQGYEPPREVIGKAVAAAICDAIARVLLLSAPSDDELKAVLLATFDEGYRRRLARFFGDEYRETLREVLAHHHLIGELDALINRLGPSDLVPVDGIATHTLTIHVLGGRNMVVRDLRSSDPYCVLELHDPALGQRQHYKTAVVAHTLDPEWDETWSAVAGSGSTLRIEVRDHDRIGSDDPMGHLELDLAELADDTPVDRWHLLDGVNDGELHLSVVRRRLRPLYADDADPLNSATAMRADLGEPGNVVEGEPPHADTPSLDDRETPEP